MSGMVKAGLTPNDIVIPDEPSSKFRFLANSEEELRYQDILPTNKTLSDILSESNQSEFQMKIKDKEESSTSSKHTSPSLVTDGSQEGAVGGGRKEYTTGSSASSMYRKDRDSRSAYQCSDSDADTSQSCFLNQGCNVEGMDNTFIDANETDFPYTNDSIENLLSKVHSKKGNSDEENKELKKRIYCMEHHERLEAGRLKLEERTLTGRIAKHRMMLNELRTEKNSLEDATRELDLLIREANRCTNKLKGEADRSKSIFESDRRTLGTLMTRIHDEIRFRTAGIESPKRLTYYYDVDLGCCKVSFPLLCLGPTVNQILTTKKISRWFSDWLRDFYPVWISVFFVLLVFSVFYIKGFVHVQCGKMNAANTDFGDGDHKKEEPKKKEDKATHEDKAKASKPEAGGTKPDSGGGKPDSGGGGDKKPEGGAKKADPGPKKTMMSGEEIKKPHVEKEAVKPKTTKHGSAGKEKSRGYKKAHSSGYSQRTIKNQGSSKYAPVHPMNPKEKITTGLEPPSLLNPPPSTYNGMGEEVILPVHDEGEALVSSKSVLG